MTEPEAREALKEIDRQLSKLPTDTRSHRELSRARAGLDLIFAELAKAREENVALRLVVDELKAKVGKPLPRRPTRVADGE